MPHLPRCLAATASLLFVTACELDESGELAVDRAALVGGTASTSDPAVALTYSVPEGMTGGGYICSGVLIAPHIVLTSPRCVDEPVALTEHWAYFGTDAMGATDPGFLGVQDVAGFAIAPGYNAAELDTIEDYALLRLTAPGPVKPLPYLRTPPPLAEGLPLRVVGWGSTAAAANDGGSKRTLATSLSRYDDARMYYGGPGSTACGGDPGAAVFAMVDGVEQLIGINATVLTSCGEAQARRLDRIAASFIDPYIAANDPGGGCLTDGECNGLCGDVDADCADLGGGGGSGGEDDSPGEGDYDEDEGDGSGDDDGPADELAGGDGNVVASCAAGGGSAGGLAILAIGALIALGARRRR